MQKKLGGIWGNMVGATPSNAQGLLLVLQSGVNHVKVRGPYVVPEIKSELVAFRISNCLPYCTISLGPHRKRVCGNPNLGEQLSP